MVRLLFIAIGCALHAPLEGGRVMLLAARESFIRDGAHVFWDSIQRVAREKVGSGTTKVVELS